MMKNIERKSLLIHLDKRETVAMLSDEQAGRLFKMLLAYAEDGTVETADDQVVQIVFSLFRQQIDHDAEKYAETCQKRADAGKKGGRPKGKAKKANGFFAFENKAKESKQKQTKAKKTDTDTETDTDTDTVCDCVTPRARAREDTHTPSAEEIIELARSQGFAWDRQEASAFLAYNIDKGRTDGWDYAVEKWEAHRPAHRPKGAGTSAPDPLMDDYLSLVNRFVKEDT